MTVTERIKKTRKSKGVSQTFIAERLGMTVSSYNMKENGKRPISTVELEKIAAILEVPIMIFFEDKIHVELNVGTA